MRRLFRVATVCICPINMTHGLYGTLGLYWMLGLYGLTLCPSSVHYLCKQFLDPDQARRNAADTISTKITCSYCYLFAPHIENNQT